MIREGPPGVFRRSLVTVPGMSRPTPRKQLIQLRLATALSQRAQAQNIGIARNALIHAEAGERIRPYTARKIADHYGRTVPELFPDLMEDWCSSS